MTYEQQITEFVLYLRDHGYTAREARAAGEKMRGYLTTGRPRRD